ncbi:MAG: MarR family winged helix-turn-helix transcriptional regulator [Flavobacteriaceae bacterium]
MHIEYPLLSSCDPSVCFSSRMMRLNRIISSIFRKHITPFGLTPSQLSILFVVAKKGNKSQRELCDLLFLEKSSTSRNLQRLLEGDLVKKNALRQIEITKEGRLLIEKIIPSWEEAMEEVRSILGKEGQDSFEVIYDRIT